MPGKDEITQALREVDARVAQLAPKIAARPDVKLPDGGWTVRDALCHMAARSNSVPMVMGMAQMMAQAAAAAGGGGAQRPPGFDIDAVNQGQIDERKGRSVEALLEEIGDGHRIAIEAIAGLDGALLAQRVRNFVTGEGDLAVSDFLFMATVRHDNAHFDDIEKAVTA